MRSSRSAAFAAVLFLAACDPGAAPADAGAAVPPSDLAAPPADTAARLTPEGWGPLRIGMTLDEVVAAAGEDANPEAVGGPEPEVCDEFRPARAPDGMIVMIEAGRLTRISVGARSGVKSDRGFGIGDPAAEVRAAYGADAVRTPHKYVEAPAEYVVVWTTPPPGPDARGILYEIGADGRVAHVRVGGPSIEYVEGCL